jgi:hypothetical protein
VFANSDTPHSSGFAPAYLPLVHSSDEEIAARVARAELPFTVAAVEPLKECESFLDAALAPKASLAKIEEINIISEQCK